MIGNTYTVTGKNTDVLWQFGYDTEGNIISFQFLNGKLDEKQERWLFHSPVKFPYKESMIENWQSSIKNFNVEKGEPDITFDRFYNTYAVKQKRAVTKELWEKLSKRNKIDAIAYIKRFNDFLKRNGTGKPLPDTYIRQKRWLD